jgi:hypothetical protein
MTITSNLSLVDESKNRIITIFNIMFETPYTENIDDLIMYWNELANINTIKIQQSDLIDELIDVLNLYSKLMDQIFIETMNSFIINYSATDTNDIKLLQQLQLSDAALETGKVNHLTNIVYKRITAIDNELINNSIDEINRNV